MKKKVMSRQDLLDNKDQLISDYKGIHRKFAKKPQLSKKERKVLGIGKDEGRALVKNIRISPSKVRIVARLIYGKSLADAKAILQFTPKAASPVLMKLLKSAEANAVNNNELNPEALFVAEIQVGEGPTLKRWRPRGKGSASPILKRSCRISIVLREQA